MSFVDLIIKKRNNCELTSEEINFFINGVTDGSIPDYQISAMLMAICLNSLSDREISDLTLKMAHSGDILDLSEVDGIKVDKHSTGGVADTTTLILAPLVASLNLPIIKMSGKGLGHTGGTIDKLDSIPNFNTSISKETALKLVKKNNIVLMGQTADLAPADKKLYALRDVTGTVESIPLIASSIMSKKIAAGANAIVLDIKCGNGAFVKDIKAARLLAKQMVSIGKNLNKQVVAIITDMNEPLGTHIGNSFEVIEALEVLKGNTCGKLKDLSLTIGAYMLICGQVCKTVEEGKRLLEEAIENKSGLEKFKTLISSQNGNPDVITDYSLLPRSSCKTTLTADKSGYIYSMDTYSIGKASVETGAGRKTKTDSIDYGAGIILKHRLGDYVFKGEVLSEIYASSEDKCKAALKILSKSIIIKPDKPKDNKIILDIIGG